MFLSKRIRLNVIANWVVAAVLKVYLSLMSDC